MISGVPESVCTTAVVDMADPSIVHVKWTPPPAGPLEPGERVVFSNLGDDTRTVDYKLPYAVDSKSVRAVTDDDDAESLVLSFKVLPTAIDAPVVCAPRKRKSAV